MQISRALWSELELLVPVVMLHEQLRGLVFSTPCGQLSGATGGAGRLLCCTFVCMYIRN